MEQNPLLNCMKTFLAKKPLDMALAFKHAVLAGRQSFLSGRIQKNYIGEPSSPLKGII